MKERLLLEQKNFCAYTEKYVEELDSVEVEHFNSALKKTGDDYFNYYAVIRDANLRKKDEKYVGASFFSSLFFQKPGAFELRVKFFPKSGEYAILDLNDREADDLIDFLGFNDFSLVNQRTRHLKRLKATFERGRFDRSEIVEYFQENPHDLSFITAIEAEFNLDLSEFYT
ncbi:MAG: hypothetical protein H6581_07720 [Bacteroidia bacterium]|nr:hypothetical protein [Bacteroidia bacterium]